ncbi:MAG: PAS domain-containing sensor histidine kinase [Ignavibacteriales bacterium]|nr:PAS domain-containing sensor histidine kinase [Ignavibacteriales bacterium]
MKNYDIDFGTIFNEIGIGLLINDIDGNILAINARGKELLKLVFTQASLNQQTSEISNVKLLLNAKKCFYAPDIVKNGNPVYNRRIRCLTEKDESVLFNVNSFPLVNTDGEVTEIFNTFENTIDESFLENSLKDTTKNIEAVLYSTPPDGSKFIFITEAVVKMLGFTPQDLLHNPRLIVRQINRNDLVKFKGFVRELRKGNSATVEYQIKDKWGKQHFIRNSGFPVHQDGTVIKIDGVLSDITKETTAKLELEKSEQRFRLLIETANDLIFNLDSYGYFITVNSYCALALGYSPEEMISKHFLEFVNENNKADIAIAFQQILKSDKRISFEATLVDKLNKDIVFEIQGRPIKLADEIIGMLGIGRDITERRKVEEKLQQLNAKLIEANRLISVERDRAKQQVSVLEEVNKLKSEFISNISHELRTPLSSIVGFSETISADPDLPKEMVMEFNDIILSEGKRLARLINDFLDFAKIEAGKMDLLKTKFNATELLTEIVTKAKAAADEKGIIFTTDIPDKDIYLFGDKERIGQVYYHLISNALKFTDRDGRVSVIGQEFNKEFEIIITDTGIGILEKDLERIFQKFFKVENPGTLSTGTGIGLGLVKQIIDLHKGLITVLSEVTKGTTFIVKLPKMVETKL